MTLATLAIGCMSLTLAQPAFAQLRLAWNDCASSAVDKSFACDVNSPIHYLAASFVAPPGINRFIGTSIEIILAFNTPVPAWWRVGGGDCRSGSIGSASTSDFAGCADPYEGAACVGPHGMSSACLTLILLEPNHGGNPARAKLSADNARTDNGVPLTAGTEYMAHVLGIRSTRTTGANACAGCLEPACLTLRRVIVAEPAYAIDVFGSSCITWQGGIVDPSGCCGPVPTRNETWGGVKSLYR